MFHLQTVPIQKRKNQNQPRKPNDMNNFKELLTAQKEALTKDINALDEELKVIELNLKLTKDRKSQATKVLKGIEKKLQGK